MFTYFLVCLLNPPQAFNQVMACCERKNRWEEAMKLFQFMCAHNIAPPPMTYWCVRQSWA